MTKNLIVCCDGTWNNSEQEENGIPNPTNVVRLYRALAEKDANGIDQKKYYHSGVGGEKFGLRERIFGGMFGIGISRHIQSAYHWLASNYENGDKIWLFGFSRGAFTARSLAGFIGKGLLDLNKLQYSNISWERVKQAYEDAYKKDLMLKEIVPADWLFQCGEPIEIQFLGVWDTVGALGIPDNYAFFNFFDIRKNWSFHHEDQLGEHVRYARHAMAIDEERASFTVTRWKSWNPQTTDAQELWFPGVHSDVGGGYSETDLSNIALKWMIDESKKSGLQFQDNLKIEINPCGILHNSRCGSFAKLRSRPRNYPAINKENSNLFHPSVFERQQHLSLQYPPYHPSKELEVGESCIFEIFAGQHWNKTNFYLKVGPQYCFSAKGRWINRKKSYGWKGALHLGCTLTGCVHRFQSFRGKIETFFQRLTGNVSADFRGTKRVEQYNWFALIGTIANDSGTPNAVKNDGSPCQHQYINLSQYKTTQLSIDAPGYLYCFANDTWGDYNRNRGSIQLTITRVK